MNHNIPLGFLERTLCGDGYHDPAAPENEKCDDGGFSDVDSSGHYDGCTQDCQITLQGWHCGVPGVPCEHLCGNGVLDVRSIIIIIIIINIIILGMGMSYPVSAYTQEICDEGPTWQVGSTSK